MIRARPWRPRRSMAANLCPGAFVLFVATVPAQEIEGRADTFGVLDVKVDRRLTLIEVRMTPLADRFALPT